MGRATYIFDVDGVLNSTSDYHPNIQVIEQIAKLLNNDIYVALNTGRGYAWVKENILKKLHTLVADSKQDNIFIAAEMGGVAVAFSDGVERDTRSAFSLTPNQIGMVKQIYDQRSVSHNLRWYEGKVSKATIYKPFGADTAAFLAEAQEIATMLQKLFSNDDIKISLNPDALDVMAAEAGKWAGAQLIHDWLLRTPAANSKHFICFGDNASDFEMARYFSRRNHAVEFVFTGEDAGRMAHDKRVKFTKANPPYAMGTLEYLRKVTSE